MKLGSGNSYWPTSKIIRSCKSQEVGRVSHIRPTTQKKQITTRASNSCNLSHNPV